MDEYLIGRQVRIVGEFTVQDSAHPNDPTKRMFADPSQTKLTIRHEDDAGPTVIWVWGVDLPLQKRDIGRYYTDYIFPRAGVWFYRFEGTGNVTAPVERGVRIVPSSVIG